MLKIYIYLTIIPLIFVSCSKPTVVGNWSVSEETLFEAIETSSEMSYYYDLELKEKLASQISKNTIYSFSENGLLSIEVQSTSDSIYHNFSGSWKSLDLKTMEIAIGNNSSQEYSFKLSDNFLILESLLDTTKKLILEKK